MKQRKGGTECAARSQRRERKSLHDTAFSVCYRSVRRRTLYGRNRGLSAMQQIKRIGKLEIVVFLPRRWLDHLLVLLLDSLAREVARQIGFARPQQLGGVAIIALAYGVIRNDAGGLNGMPRRGIVASCREIGRA